jgi:hypothetical protein
LLSLLFVKQMEKMRKLPCGLRWWYNTAVGILQYYYYARQLPSESAYSDGGRSELLYIRRLVDIRASSRGSLIIRPARTLTFIKVFVSR